MGFFFPSIVLEESGISDGVDMDVLRGSTGGFLEVGIVVGGVGGVGKVEILRLVRGFINGQGSLIPVDGRVDVFEPGES